MSFDLYPPPDPADPPFPGGDPTYALDRLQWPAILLIALGLFNLIAALFVLFLLVQIALTPEDQSYAQLRQLADKLPANNPWRTVLEKSLADHTPASLKTQNVLYYSVGLAVCLLTALLPLLSGLQMLRLRTYGLAVLGAIVVAIPGLSPVACCCAGELVGIWALIVLLNADVRSAFH